MKDKKALIHNLIFAGILLAAALGLWLFTGQRAEAATAVLTYGAELKTLEIDLGHDEIYHVDTGFLTVNIEVKDGAARFFDSPCPDHICEGYGWLSKDGDTATCLPARASLMVMAKE